MDFSTDFIAESRTGTDFSTDFIADSRMETHFSTDFVTASRMETDKRMRERILKRVTGLGNGY